MDERRRPTPPKVLHNSKGGSRLSIRATRKPPSQGGESITAILLALAERHEKGNGNIRRAARIIIAAAGSLKPHQLRTAHAFEIDAAITNGGYAHSTRRNTAAAAIRILWWLTRHHGAPDIGEHINKHPGLRPRNVTAKEAEKQALLGHAPNHMKLWLLLCSDLAIRSGTAAKLGWGNYDEDNRELRFTTKLGERLTMPVTNEIAAIIDATDSRDTTPFVRQLHKASLAPGHKLISAPKGKDYHHTLEVAFFRLRKKLGITRKLTPHDFRRTTAVALYRHTRDARDVQALLGHRTLASTIWYLDHDLRPVNRKTLELIKGTRKPTPPKEKTA